MIACARRPSRRSSQDTCEPSPGTSPKATPRRRPRATRSPCARRRSPRPSRRSPRRRGSARATRPRRRSPPGESSSRAGAVDAADRSDVRADLDAQRAQERLRQRAHGHPRGGLARAGALEHVAHVGEAVLLDAGQVGVPGARQVHLVHLAVHRPGVHPLLPVRVVAVGHQQGHRAAERAAVADPGGHLGAVLLDLHAPAAAVAELAPREVAVDVLGAQLEAGRQALENGHEPGPVRLAGCCEAERHRAPKATRKGRRCRSLVDWARSRRQRSAKGCSRRLLRCPG